MNDTLEETLSHLSPAETGRVAAVAQSWRKMASYVQIKTINKGKLPLHIVLIGMNAKQAIEWLIKNPACKSLEIADFTGMTGFDNECLQKLTDTCPNLKHLFIPKSNIHGHALKHLDKTPQLQSLNISNCCQLEADKIPAKLSFLLKR